MITDSDEKMWNMRMAQPNLTKLSKFLALVLRHKANNFGLELDSNGYAEVETLWALIENRFGDAYLIDDLLTVVEGDRQGKKRYELVDGKIRALFGHSTVEHIAYPSVQPPHQLFHGTTADAVDAILQTGLEARSRQYVHLTSDYGMAQMVARRHSQHTVILVVLAQEAYEAGVIFHNPAPNIYLAQTIPAQFIALKRA